MNPKTMLELQKMVLINVSDDQILFEKELRKSFIWLAKDDLVHLYEWLVENFNNRYQGLIKFLFGGVNTAVS